MNAIFLNCGEANSLKPLEHFEQAKQQLVNRLLDLGLRLSTPIYAFHLSPDQPVPINTEQPGGDIYASYPRLAAIAGIGNPHRFFNTLKSQGLHFSAHPFNDHHAFTQQEIASIDADAIVMTEKDAVKCQSLESSTPLYYLPVNAHFEPRLNNWLTRRIRSLSPTAK